MHTWNWDTWQGLPYLTCDLLRPWPHGFFTQQWWPRNPAELVEALAPSATPFWTKQVHGNTVVFPKDFQGMALRVSNSEHLGSEHSGSEPEMELPSADGLVTDGYEQAVWVCSADCTPVLIADVQSGQVAAIHSGWRGTAAKIVPQAVQQLQQQGSAIANLRVAMGPAIAGEVYQVSVEVAVELGRTIIPLSSCPSTRDSDGPNDDGPNDDGPNSDGPNDTTLLDVLHQLSLSPLLPDSEPGRVRVDIRRVIALQLEQLGLLPEQVAIAPHCTYQQPEYFFSYRRERQKKVQWSGIVSTSQ